MVVHESKYLKLHKHLLIARELSREFGLAILRGLTGIDRLNPVHNKMPLHRAILQDPFAQEMSVTLGCRVSVLS